MDSLVYASLENQYNDTNSLAWFNRNISPSNTLPGTNVEKTIELNKILSETTIKRACCLGVDKIKVKIPIPMDTDLNQYTKKGIMEKYGYFEKEVTVPESLCNPSWKVKNPDTNRSQCDNFYTVYCKNKVNLYKAGNKGNFNAVEFQDYSPDCVCYGDMPEVLRTANVAPKCALAGCETSLEGGGYYVDPISRSADCEMTICSQTFNASDVTVGGDASIMAKMNNQCGVAAVLDTVEDHDEDNGEDEVSNEAPDKEPVMVSETKTVQDTTVSPGSSESSEEVGSSESSEEVESPGSSEEAKSSGSSEEAESSGSSEESESEESSLLSTLSTTHKLYIGIGLSVCCVFLVFLAMRPKSRPMYRRF